jgi:hypothetical protein
LLVRLSTGADCIAGYSDIGGRFALLLLQLSSKPKLLLRCGVRSCVPCSDSGSHPLVALVFFGNLVYLVIFHRVSQSKSSYTKQFFYYCKLPTLFGHGQSGPD